jgi:hypothetical protein
MQKMNERKENEKKKKKTLVEWVNTRNKSTIGIRLI